MTWWCQWLTLIHCRGDDIDARENILSKKLLEAGCECCDSSATLRELLADVVKDIHEQDVAIALGSMAQSYADGTTSGESNWNVENFVGVIVDLVWARWLFYNRHHWLIRFLSGTCYWLGKSDTKLGLWTFHYLRCQELGDHYSCMETLSKGLHWYIHLYIYGGWWLNI